MNFYKQVVDPKMAKAWLDFQDKVKLLRTLGMDDGDIAKWLGDEWGADLRKIMRAKKNADLG